MERGEWGHSFEGRRRERTAFRRAQPLLGPVTYFLCGPGSPARTQQVCDHKHCATSFFKQGTKVTISLPLCIGHQLRGAGWEETVGVTPLPSLRLKEMRL